VPVRTAGDLDAALESARREHADGLVVHPDVLIGPHRRRIAEFALRHRLSAIEPFGAFPDAGSISSHGGCCPSSESDTQYRFLLRRCTRTQAAAN
jgi:hypothetical protein